MRHLLFPLGKSNFELLGHIDFCTAKMNWKCKNVFPAIVHMRNFAVGSSIEVNIFPRLVGRLRGTVFNEFAALHLVPRLDFRQQDNWLNVIVQERKVKFHHLFDELYDNVIVNVGDLLISNKLLEFKQSNKYGNLLFYSHFSKHEIKDLIMDALVTSKFNDMFVINYVNAYTVTTQTWGNIIKLSAHDPGYLISLNGMINVAVPESIGDNVSTVLKAYWQVDKTAVRIHNNTRTELGMGLGYNFSHYMYWHKINKVYQYYYMTYQFRHVNITFSDLTSIFLERGYDLQETKQLGNWNKATSICKSKGGYLPIIKVKRNKMNSCAT